MLNRVKKSNQKGFTIIEVMIVLAIAGLILLVVLLAVPALQRNARNTTLKNDASAVAAGVAEFKSNNDGTLPTTISTTTVSSSVTGTAPATLKLSANQSIAAVTTPSATSPTPGTLGYAVGKDCSGSNPRAVAIYYTPESSGAVAKCIES